MITVRKYKKTKRVVSFGKLIGLWSVRPFVLRRRNWEKLHSQVSSERTKVER